MKFEQLSTIENKIIPKNFQGEQGDVVFRGEGKFKANQELYAYSAKNFANIIKEKLLLRDEPYILADLGGHKGELLGNIISQLPDYKFETIGIDLNEDALRENLIANKKVVASLDKLPFADKSIDVAIARYVLSWNNIDGQRNILNEIARVVKNFGIVEHGGAPRESAELWRNGFNQLFNGEQIPSLKRDIHFFSSGNELENLMIESGISFECVSDKKIDNVSDVFIEKWKLNEDDASKAKEILNDKDYIIQTRWVIYPKE